MSTLKDNKLFSSCQSGFRRNDSCTSQLLAITHEIFQNFDANPPLETRSVFLDISKAFDKVWHEGLLFKLKSYGVSGHFLDIIKDFLSGRYQRTVLNGQASCWKSILAGVHQGSILGPLLFLNFINDISDGILSKIKIFADDTSIFSVLKNPHLNSWQINNDLKLISEWASQWKMIFNPDPSKQAVEVCFSTKIKSSPITSLPDLTFNGSKITAVDSHKHLGLILDDKLSFHQHLNDKIAKCNKSIGLISRLRLTLPRDSLLCIYKSFVRPNLDYADVIYDSPSNELLSRKIESVQYNAALAITGAIRGTSRSKLYAELGLEELSKRRFCRRLLFFYKIINGHSSSYLKEFIPTNRNISYNLRNPNLAQYRCLLGQRSLRIHFFPFCSKQWNELDPGH